MPVRVTTLVSEWCLLLGLLTGLVWVAGVLPRPAGMVLFPLFVVVGLLAWAVELPLRARLRRQELAMAAGSVATLESPEVTTPDGAEATAAEGALHAAAVETPATETEPSDAVPTADVSGQQRVQPLGEQGRDEVPTADVSADRIGEPEPASHEDMPEVEAAGQARPADPATPAESDTAEVGAASQTAEIAAPVQTDTAEVEATGQAGAAELQTQAEPDAVEVATLVTDPAPAAHTADDPGTGDEPQRPTPRAGDREMTDNWRVEAARALAGEARETAELLRAQAEARRADATVDGPSSEKDAGDEPRHAEPPDSSRHAQN